MNNSFFIGRLVRDPELKTTESGKKVVNTTIAVQRSYKNSDGSYDADFIDCTFWEHNAEYVSKMKSGNQLAVQGRTETRIYEKENGNKVKDYNLIVDSIKNLEKTNEKSKEMDI